MFIPDNDTRYTLHYMGYGDEIYVQVYDTNRQIQVYEGSYTLAWYTRAFNAATIVRITNRYNGDYAEIVENGLKRFAATKGAEYANMGG